MSNKNNKVVFLLTNLAFQSVIGQLGVYAISKSYVAKSFNYDESFLGILEAITMVGQLIGSLSILFVSFNSVTGFLIFSILNAMCGVLLFLPRYISIVELRDFIVIFALFFRSLFVSSLAFTQIIFSYYFDQSSKKCQHSIWYGLTFFGDFFAILFTQFALDHLNFIWEWAMMLWSLYILLIGILMYFYFDDHSEGQMEIEQMLSIDSDSPNDGVQGSHKNQQILKHMSKAKECQLLITKAWKLLKEPNIFLVVLSFGLVESLYSNFLFWIPFYFISINEQAYSMVGILGCCLSISGGGIFTEIVLFELFGLEKHSKRIAYFLLTLSTAVYIVLWFKRFEEPKVQILLLCIANILISCPYNRVSTVDPIEESNGEPHKVKTVFLLAHLSRNVIAAICTVVIGFLMKRQSLYFWHVILANVILALLIETIRKLFTNTNQVQSNQMPKSIE